MGVWLKDVYFFLFFSSREESIERKYEVKKKLEKQAYWQLAKP